MLVRVYGELWNPDSVDWGSQGRGKKGRLLGTYRFGSGKRTLIDFWDQVGVYILMSDFKPIYVGKAKGIGPRLRAHISDRLAGRWDMFSWYGFCLPVERSKGLRSFQTRPLKLDDALRLSESLLARAALTPLNRQLPKLPGAQESQQHVGKPESIRRYLEVIRKEVQK